MNHKLEQVILFSIVFLLIGISNMANLHMGKTSGNLRIFISLGITLITTVLIGGLAFGLLPKQLDKFHFEVTPAKTCDGGLYMTQGAPQQKYCEKLLSTPQGRKQYYEVNCPGGLYSGRPLHMERTPMSDSQWENQMCNPPILQKNHPQVL